VWCEKDTTHKYMLSLSHTTQHALSLSHNTTLQNRGLGKYTFFGKLPLTTQHATPHTLFLSRTIPHTLFLSCTTPHTRTRLLSHTRHNTSKKRHWKIYTFVFFTNTFTHVSSLLHLLHSKKEAFENPHTCVLCRYILTCQLATQFTTLPKKGIRKYALVCFLQIHSHSACYSNLLYTMILELIYYSILLHTIIVKFI